MRCSICIATHEKCEYLENTLKSIFSQKPSFKFEVCLVDDNSEDKTIELVRKYVQRGFDIKFRKIARQKGYRNPAVPRNMAYKLAKGEIVIAQSDEVIHTDGCIEKLVNRLQPGEFRVAQVCDYNLKTNKKGRCRVDSNNKRPYFFLGSLFRKDIYRIGGNNEKFVSPAAEDDWFADCLMYGLGLRCIHDDSIIGYHQEHPIPQNVDYEPSRLLLKQLREEAEKTGIYKGGESWKYVEGKSYNELF